MVLAPLTIKMTTRTLLTILALGLTLGLGGLTLWADKGGTIEVVTEMPAEPTEKVVKTEEDWKQELTSEQYRILRQAGTERPFGKVYKDFKKQGEGKYICVGCNTVLFTSGEKFDSACGWPSFYDPADNDKVKMVPDVSGGVIRTEVRCNTCDGHLGHVFEGEGFDTPTDQRFCINGSVLRFVPAEVAAAKEAEMVKHEHGAEATSEAKVEEEKK